MIDSHAHLTMFEPAERSDALDRATRAGVARVLVPSTGRDDLDQGLEAFGQVGRELGVLK